MIETVRITAIAVATVDGMMRENDALAQRLGIMLFPEAFAAGYCGADLTAHAVEIEGELPVRR